jgi:hypothetical protein
VKKRTGDDEHKAVNSIVRYRIEMVAYRDKLDLVKPADRMAAQQKAFAEDPDLYERYRTANTVRVGKVALTD